MKFTKNLIRRIAIILVLMILINLIYTSIYSVAMAAPTKYTQTLISGIDNFPSEYQESLKKLKELHPNWSFEAYYTGLPWSTLVDNETVHKRNRVIKSADSSWRCSCGNVASGYACASESIIKYFLDPKNFLNEVNIFQFLEISYNSKVHNLDGIKSIVKGTFLDNTISVKKGEKNEETGEIESIDMTYSQIILEAAEKTKMSPYSIAIKIIQEVGSKGSDSVSGTHKGYEGYYNFYNLGAYDTGNAIDNALIYAKEKKWDNQYDAIIEGAKEIANSYTNAGQNTAYFYKWDVVGTSILQSGESQTISSSDMFWHQYMTNVQDPTSQSVSLYNTYAQNNILDKELNFIIPIYENMPSSNKLPSELTEEDGELYYVNCTDGLRVRQSASTSAKILETLGKDVIIVMLERKSIKAENMYWDKIKLSNGVIGYVASEFLTSCDKKNEDTTSNDIKVIGTAISKENLKLRRTAGTEGILITTIPKGETIEIIEKNSSDSNGYTWYKVRYNNNIGYVASEYLNVNKQKFKIETNILKAVPEMNVREIEGATLVGEKIATGSKIKVNGKEYTLVVLADVNGDSEINSADLLVVVKHLKGTEKLNKTEYLEAADINEDSEINSADLLIIVKHLKGTKISF